MRSLVRRAGVLVVAVLWLPTLAFAATGTVMPSPLFVGLDANGNPINGGKLCVYTAGTSTPVDTFSEVTLTTANKNPVLLDAAGRATVFLTPGVSYKFVLRSPGSDTTCATGTIQWTQDNVSSVQGSADNVDVLGTAGSTTLTNGDVVYLSDGDASLAGTVAGLWYQAKADNPHSSTAVVVGMVQTTIPASTAGTIRILGRLSALPYSLSVGTPYYISSSTAGLITLTPPTTNRRLLGVADTTTSFVLVPTAIQPQWTTVPYTLGDYTDTGAGAWAVGAGDLITFKYLLEGKTLRIALTLDTTTITGVVTDVRVLIPGGFTSTAKVAATYTLYDNSASVFEIGTCSIINGGTTMVFLRAGAGPPAFTASADLTYLRLVTSFEVQ